MSRAIPTNDPLVTSQCPGGSDEEDHVADAAGHQLLPRQQLHTPRRQAREPPAYEEPGPQALRLRFCEKYEWVFG